jgi:diguanylate cyclase (GGDEF)-like protein/PAS domain S-box-containing protein
VIDDSIHDPSSSQAPKNQDRPTAIKHCMRYPPCTFLAASTMNNIKLGEIPTPGPASISAALSMTQTARIDMLDRIIANQPLADILRIAVEHLEKLFPAMRASVLQINAHTGCLEQCIAPGLPDYYLAAIEGLHPGPGVYSCGTAAYSGETVIVEDVQTHPYWATLRELTARAGFRACTAVPFKGGDGKVLGVVSLHFDHPHLPDDTELGLFGEFARMAAIAVEKERAASQRSEITASLSQSEARYRSLVEAAPFPVVISRLTDGALLYGNHRAELMFGISREQGTGELAAKFYVDPHERARIIAKVLEKQIITDEEVRLYKAGGEIIWVLLSACIMEFDGQPSLLSSLVEISEIKEHQERLNFMAHHDALTRLPNRSMVETRLEQEIEQAHRHGLRLAVLFFDLDHFKIINDSFVHPVGDELLCAVAGRLNLRLREGDTLARQGGDEFILLASTLSDTQDAAVVARDIINSLSEPFLLSGVHEVFISCSIGISLFPNDGSTVTELMKNADAAMYYAKENGRNQFSFYTKELNADARSKLMMENDLHRALLNNELQLHYQTKIDLRSGKICGVEALIRWSKPDGTLMSPAEFIPLAEKTGVILTLGNMVLERACLQIRQWLDEGLKDVLVAINISSRQFRNGNLDKLIEQSLRKYKIDGRHLELELNESMMMHEPERAIETMQNLKKLGVKLTLDDFGTGYSNLAYLRRFPIDSLKIDQSFVHGMITDPGDAEIANIIIDLAHSLKLSVLAKGVENTDQLSLMRSKGCDELQGYLFSKALPASQAGEMMRSGKTLIV